MFEMLKGEKVRLREYRREDIELAQTYINDYEVSRNLSPGIPFPLLTHDEEKWFQSQSSQNHTYSFAIESVSDAQYIGGCGVNAVDWKNSVASVGIFIGDKGYWNKGYGSEAMGLLLRFIFTQMNINKVRLDVYSFNERAIACYTKCGFLTEGVRRQELFRDGRYYDIIIMGVLRNEWKTSLTQR